MMNIQLLKPLFINCHFNYPGHIYGSAMPFGLYDPDGKLFDELKEARINVIVLLAEIEECQEKAGRDLLSLYRDEGLTVLHLPIPNYGLPSTGKLSCVLTQTLEHAANAITC